MAFQKIGEVTDLDPCTARQVDVYTSTGVLVQLALICDENGDFYAIDDLCTHGEVSLSEGEIGDKCVQCWAHGAEFVLCTGKATLPAVEPVKVYPIRLDGDSVLVDVDTISEEK